MTVTANALSKTITVEAPQQRAFEIFTAGFDSWWPRSHHTGEGELRQAVIEPREGGRWYATTSVGNEEWGRVLVWDPPHRVVLDWQLTAEFSYDADFHSEVEARFVAEGPTRTRLEFEHRNLDRYGDRAAAMAQTLDSEGGWTGILAGYAAVASGVASS
jgi:uncharacterized protein YndB with AHSA1/START domain